MLWVVFFQGNTFQPGMSLDSHYTWCTRNQVGTKTAVLAKNTWCLLGNRPPLLYLRAHRPLLRKPQLLLLPMQPFPSSCVTLNSCRCHPHRARPQDNTFENHYMTIYNIQPQDNKSLWGKPSVGQIHLDNKIREDMQGQVS
jgi:hypothetical protein